MTVVCDFQMIHGVRNGVIIGEGGFHPVWETTFNTGGRLATGFAFLTFMIRGLTVASNPLPIKINNTVEGHIHPYVGANPSHWFSQTINLDGNGIRDGVNELEVPAALNPSSTGGAYDDFVLKNVMCFFQQNA